jgi:hypothetical protein
MGWCGVECHGMKDDFLGTGGKTGPTWFLVLFGCVISMLLLEEVSHFVRARESCGS